MSAWEPGQAWGLGALPSWCLPVLPWRRRHRQEQELLRWGRYAGSLPGNELGGPSAVPPGSCHPRPPLVPAGDCGERTDQLLLAQRGLCCHGRGKPGHPQGSPGPFRRPQEVPCSKCCLPPSLAQSVPVLFYVTWEPYLPAHCKPEFLFRS